MRYDEFTTEHLPAKSHDPRRVAKLCAYKAEFADMQAMCKAHGASEIVAVNKLPIIAAATIHVLCPDPDTAWALTQAWWAYSETSPHRRPS